jgi:aubergine-like protein
MHSAALRDKEYGQEDFKNYILGKVVVTQYNNFTYRVDDVDWERNPMSLFDCNGKQVSFQNTIFNRMKLLR